MVNIQSQNFFIKTKKATPNGMAFEKYFTKFIWMLFYV